MSSTTGALTPFAHGQLTSATSNVAVTVTFSNTGEDGAADGGVREPRRPLLPTLDTGASRPLT